MARIAGVDLPRDKRVEIGFRYVVRRQRLMQELAKVLREL